MLLIIAIIAILTPVLTYTPINPELERLILGYGGHAEVIAPPEFRERIANSIRIANSHYSEKQTEL